MYKGVCKNGGQNIRYPSLLKRTKKERGMCVKFAAKSVYIGVR